MGLWHWLVHQAGIDQGAPYGTWVPGNFWSGIAGSFLVNLITFALLFWWHHQCNVSGCYWYARRTTAAGERACWLHHPHAKRTAEDIHAAHHEALRRGN